MDRRINLLVEDQQRPGNPKDDEQRADAEPETEMGCTDEAADALHDQNLTLMLPVMLRPSPGLCSVCAPSHHAYS